MISPLCLSMLQHCCNLSLIVAVAGFEPAHTNGLESNQPSLMIDIIVITDMAMISIAILPLCLFLTSYKRRLSFYHIELHGTISQLAPVLILIALPGAHTHLVILINTVRACHWYGSLLSCCQHWLSPRLPVRSRISLRIASRLSICICFGMIVLGTITCNLTMMALVGFPA